MVDSIDEFFVFLRLSIFFPDDWDSEVDRLGANFDLCSGLFEVSGWTIISTDFWLTALERCRGPLEVVGSTFGTSVGTDCSDSIAIIVNSLITRMIELNQFNEAGLRSHRRARLINAVDARHRQMDDDVGIVRLVTPSSPLATITEGYRRHFTIAVDVH